MQNLLNFVDLDEVGAQVALDAVVTDGVDAFKLAWLDRTEPDDPSVMVNLVRTLMSGFDPRAARSDMVDQDGMRTRLAEAEIGASRGVRVHVAAYASARAPGTYLMERLPDRAHIGEEDWEETEKRVLVVLSRHIENLL